MNVATSIAPALAALLLAAGTALAGEGGTALKAADLHAEPFRDAKTIGSLSRGDTVEILTRQGGWFRVKSGAGTGWVRMLSIRRGEARKASADASGLLGLASGRAGTGRVVATTGIRGLDEEELKAARFDEAELRKAESFAATPAEARAFAAAGKLAARPVEYLPSPDAVPGGRP